MEQAPRDNEMSRPLGPAEIGELKKSQIPPEVYEAFNRLIAENFSNGRACVYQEEVLELIASEDLPRAEIFKRGWLDVEDSYRQQGWTVRYDKPGYNETGRAYFEFAAAKNTDRG